MNNCSFNKTKVITLKALGVGIERQLIYCIIFFKIQVNAVRIYEPIKTDQWLAWVLIHYVCLLIFFFCFGDDIIVQGEINSFFQWSQGLVLCPLPSLFAFVLLNNWFAQHILMNYSSSCFWSTKDHIVLFQGKILNFVKRKSPLP